MRINADAIRRTIGRTRGGLFWRRRFWQREPSRAFSFPTAAFPKRACLAGRLAQIAAGTGINDSIVATDDGEGNVNQVLSQSKSFVLTVKSLSEAPVIVAPRQVVAVAGQPMSIAIDVSDADQDALDWSAVGLPLGAVLTPSAYYGKATLTWTPSTDDLGAHDLELVVADSGLPPQGAGFQNPDQPIPNVVRQFLRIVVRETNAAPALLGLTVDGEAIADVSDAATAIRLNAREGVPFDLDLFAQDADADLITWTWSGLPRGMSADPSVSNRVRLAWTPDAFAAQDGNTGVGGNPATPGLWRFTVSGSDGQQQFSRTVEIDVANVNRAPTILPMPLQLISEGDTLGFTMRAADIDQDVVSLSLIHDQDTPAGIHFDATTGYFEWTPDQAAVDNLTADSRAYTFTFRASDGTASTTQTVLVRVLDVNHAPELTVSNHAVQVGDTLRLDVAPGSNPSSGFSLVDEDGSAQTAALSIAFTGLPEGASYDAASRQLVWTPGPGQIGDTLVTARISDGKNTTSRSFVLRAVADNTANAPKILVSTTPSVPAQPGQTIVTSVRADAWSGIASLTAEQQLPDGSWQTLSLDAAGRVRIVAGEPGLMNLRVTATDHDGFTSTQLHTLRVKDPADTGAPQLAWSGSLTGRNANSEPLIVSSALDLAASITARVAEVQLMGFTLAIAPVGSDNWTVLQQQDRAAETVNATLALANLDPQDWANGVYQLRFTAWDLMGRTSEIEARVIVDSSAKATPQATVADATYTLGGHDFTLTRVLGSDQDRHESHDFGNWQLPLLDTRLTTDQPASEESGLQAAWRDGARVWLTVPAGLAGTAAAEGLAALRFTLATTAERLGEQPDAPLVWHPVFENADPASGWTLAALDPNSEATISLQRQGDKLFDRASGLPWAATGYRLTSADGTRYTLDAQGKIEQIDFADGASWLVTDAGIVAINGSHGTPGGDRLDFVRDAQGRIERIAGVRQGASEATSIAYRFDPAGRLILARQMGSDAMGTPYGYDQHGQLLTDELTAYLGTSTAWSASGVWSGILQPQGTPLGQASGNATVGFTIRDSEIVSTVHTPGGQGAVIVVIEAELPSGATLEVVGGQTLGTAIVNGKTITLVRFTDAGLKLVRLHGTGASAESASLRVSIAGDLNRDGTVNGTDAALWSAAEQSANAAGDLNGDGKLDATDRQLLFANTGFAANRAPQAAESLPTVKTHTDLATTTTLADLASDFEGDAVFWRIQSSTHGTAKLAADGRTLIFTPDASYSGVASIFLQADDGYNLGAPIELAVNVSGAKLLNIHLDRIASLRIGETGRFNAIGDFEDEQGVHLLGNYLNIETSDASVAANAVDGTIRGLGSGIALITATARGIKAVNALSVGTAPVRPSTDAHGNEIDVFPLSIVLPAETGQRQIDIHTLAAAGLLGLDQTGDAELRYFVSDPSVATVSADGLIRANHLGEATITVVKGGLQGKLVLRVVTPIVGPALVPVSEGGVVQDAEGNTLMIGAGALSADTTVSIHATDVADLDIPPPAQGVLQTYATVRVDTGGQSANYPMQLALKVNPHVDPETGVATPLATGTKVWFWREGEITLADGSSHKTWWLIDDGVIGDDGLAHTASPPYSGLLVDGNLALTSAPKVDEQNGDFSVQGHVLNIDAVYFSQACVAMAVSAGALGGVGPALIAFAAAEAAFASTQMTALSYSFAGTYQRNVPADQVTAEFLAEYPAAPLPEGSTVPDITGMVYDNQTRALTLTGSNFLPEGQAVENFSWKVWLEPRGNQLTQYTNGESERGLVWQGFDAELNLEDGSLKVTLPKGVALSQHIVWVQRITLVPDGNGIRQSGDFEDSQAVEAWTDGTDVTVVASPDSIKLYRPVDSENGIALVADIKTDGSGSPLMMARGASQGVAYSDDGTLAYVAGVDGKIHIVDLVTKTVPYSFTLPSVGRINALAVCEDWLYVAQSDAAGGRGGLTRVYVDQTSSNFLDLAQSLALPVLRDVTSYVGLAINNNSYLGVIASGGNGSGIAAFIDLNQVSPDGQVAPTAMIVLNNNLYPKPGMGKNPAHIASGRDSGQFVVSNRGDMHYGLVGLTLKFDDSGQINAATELELKINKLDGFVPNTYLGYDAQTNRSMWSPRKTYHEDIQAASGAVLLEYAGEQYAIVADFNLWFQDPLVAQYQNEVPHTQIGGKVGVIKNPFGENGEAPVYLGATTPIVGSAVRKLSLAADGTLYADVWNYQPNLDLNSEFSDSIYAWDAPALIQGALNAYARDSKREYPIDRDLPSNPNVQAPLIKELTPARYDSDGKGNVFKTWMTLGGYSVPGEFPTFAEKTVRPPAIVYTPQEQPVPITAGFEGTGFGYVLEGVNLLSGGYVERADQRMYKYHTGQLSYNQMVYGNLIDMAATTGAFVVSGGVASGLTVKMTAKGYSLFETMVGAGAAAGFSFEYLEQVGANAIYLASGGADGHLGLDFEKLAWATGGGGAVGGGLAVLAKGFGWLASKVLAASAVRSATPRSTSLVHENPPDIQGKTTLFSWGKFAETPSANSITLARAGNWLSEQSAKISDLVSNAPNSNQAMLRAYQWLVDLRAGAKAGLYDSELSAVLEARYQIPSLDSLVAKYKKPGGLSGDALYKQVIQDIENLFQTRYPEQVGGCFIAGTLVHTDKGLVPIEQIKVGDMVLSQPEQTGEMAYKRVVNTFQFDDKEIWVVKIRNWDPNASAPDAEVRQLYCTGNHPFWVDGLGWTAAENLRDGHHLRLADGSDASVIIVWPVLRTPTPAVGWVPADTLKSWDGLERAHIVDFRNGCNLWQYPMWRCEETAVPYREQFCFDDIPGLFGSAAMADVFYGDDRIFKTRVFNLEVEDFHTYFVGSLGVWVHNRNCYSLELVHPTRGVKVPNETRLFESHKELQEFVRNNPDFRSMVVVRSDTTARLERAKELGVDPEQWALWEDMVGGRLVEPFAASSGVRTRFEPALVFENGAAGRSYIRGDGFNVIDNVPTVVDTKMGMVQALSTADRQARYVVDHLRRITSALEQNPGYNWLVEIRGWKNLEAGKEGTVSYRQISSLLDDIRNDAQWLKDKGIDSRLLSRIKDVLDSGRLKFVDADAEPLLPYQPLGALIPDAAETAPALGAEDTVAIIEAARAYWIDLGANEARLNDVHVVVESLPAGIAGWTIGNRVSVSANGAGWGWYVDSSPTDSAEFIPTALPNEFVADPNSDAAGRLDLLTVLIHEFGHMLGLGHSVVSSDEMSSTLAPGVRRLPDIDPGDLMAVGFSKTVSATTRSAVGELAGATQFAYLANPELQNPEFENGAAWSAQGNVAFAEGIATLQETAATQTRLNQVFVVGEHDRFLSFTLAGLGLGDQAAGPDDAFEVALIDASTGAALLGGSGLSKSDAFLNLQANGNERKASAVSRLQNADGSRTYLVDLAGIATGTVVNLSFDLIGFGKGLEATNSQITVRDLRLGVPQTADDSASGGEDSAIAIDALANDLNALQPGFVPVVVSGPVHGSVAVEANTSFTYVPHADWFGEDEFTYRLSDGVVDSNLATVRITVAAVNDAPTSADLSLAGQEDTAVSGNVLVAATDVDGDALTAALVTGPAHGTLQLAAEGGFTYTPEADWYGEDSFTVRVNDGALDSAIATVRLTVTPVNDAPTVAPRTITLDEDSPVVLDLLAGAADIDGDVLSVEITSQPQHGTLTQNADGTWTYAPAANFNGSDSFTCRVNDGELDSNLATVVLTVAPVNDAPTVAPRTITLDEDAPIVLDLLDGAADVDGDALSVEITTQPQHGALTQNPDGTWTYAPEANFNGSDSFTYRVNDGELDSNLATVVLTVTPVNDAPTIAPRTITLDEDTQVVLDLLDGAADVDGDALSVIITTQPQHGILTQNADGTWTYAPDANWNGSDVVEYLVSDGLANTATQISFVVTPVNDAPVASELAATLLEDGTITLNLLEGAFDVDGDALTTMAAGAANGQLIKNDDGTWTYVPHANWNGEETLSYTVSDGQLGSELASIRLTITAVNDAPVAADDTAALVEDGRITLALLANDGDIDGDALTVVIETLPAHGSLILNADNTVTYVPAKDFSGEEVFTYHVNDGELDSAVATVRLIVNAVADAPTLVLTERPGATSEVFRTGWESGRSAGDDCRDGDRDDRNAGRPPLLKQDGLDGWTLVRRRDDDNEHDHDRGEGPEGFELWHDGESMQDARHRRHVVHAAEGNGSTWLELSDAKGEGHQTTGIERTVSTVAGATYTLSLDLAGHLGYGANDTRVGIYVDGVEIGRAEDTSPNDALAWTTRSFSFIGSGGAQTIRLLAEPSRRESNGRGMMIDDLALTETLPPNTGREDASVPLSAVGALLNDVDGSEALRLTIEALPIGATLSDGTNVFVASEGQTTADITGWALGSLSLRPAANFNGTLTLQVVATATEAQNGDSASTTAELTVTVLAVNDAPNAQDASFTLLEDGSVRIDFAGLVSDADGDPLTLTLGKPDRGTLTRNVDGSYTYVPKKGYSGADSFSYTVSDGQTSATATVALTMTPKPKDDDDACHHDNGQHRGFDHSGHNGYRECDDDRSLNDGRSASVTVRSAQAGKGDDDRDDHGAPLVVDQGRRMGDNAIKVDWTIGASTHLGAVRVRDDQWATGSLKNGAQGKSLAEQTGLVVRCGK